MFVTIFGLACLAGIFVHHFLCVNICHAFLVGIFCQAFLVAIFVAICLGMFATFLRGLLCFVTMLFCLPCLWPFLVAIFVAICACHKAIISLWFFAQHICLPCLWRPPETRWSLHPHSVFKLSQGAELDLKRWERERELQKESEREFHERFHGKLHERLHTKSNKMELRKRIARSRWEEFYPKKRLEIGKLLLFRDFKSLIFHYNWRA